MDRCLILTSDDSTFRRVDALLREHGARVLARLPPHLMEVAPGGEGVPELPAGARAYEGCVPDADLEGLPPAARMMADAMVAARSDAASPPGEGRAWDSPGFVPPDRI